MDIFSKLANLNFSEIRLVPLENLAHGGSFIRAKFEDVAHNLSSHHAGVLDLEHSNIPSNRILRDWNLFDRWDDYDGFQFPTLRNSSRGSEAVADSMGDVVASIPRFGSYVSRSAPVTLGPVLLSLVIGLLFWTGIFQYIGIKNTNRRLAYATEKEALDAVAQQVLKDLLADKKETNLLSEISKKTGRPIPYPVPVSVGPTNTVFSVIGNPSRTMEGRMGVVEAEVVIPLRRNRHVSRRKGGGRRNGGRRKTFRSSPLLEIHSTHQRREKWLKVPKSTYRTMNSRLSGNTDQLVDGSENPTIILKPVSVSQSSRGTNSARDTRPSKTSIQNFSQSALSGLSKRQQIKNPRMKDHQSVLNESFKFSDINAKQNERYVGKATNVLPKQSTSYNSFQMDEYRSGWNSKTDAQNDFLQYHPSANQRRAKHEVVSTNKSHFGSAKHEDHSGHPDLFESSAIINEYRNPTFENEYLKFWINDGKVSDERKLDDAKETWFPGTGSHLTYQKNESRFHTAEPPSFENDQLNHKFGKPNLEVLGLENDISHPHIRFEKEVSNTKAATTSTRNKILEKFRGVSTELLKALFPEFMKNHPNDEN